MSIPVTLRRLMVPVAVTVSIVALPLATERPAAACSCVTASDERRLAESVAVFSGEVTGQEEVGADPMRPGDAASIWTFTVSRVFKGTLGPTVRVASPIDGGSCGLELPPTGPALVFTQEPGGFAPPVSGIGLSANLCNGTRSLIGSPIPPAFGEGRDPGTPPPVRPTGTSTRDPALLWAAIGGLAAAVALAAGLVLGRRRARRISAS